MADLAAADFIELWVPEERRRFAKGLGAKEVDGRFFVEASREDDNANQLRGFFGTAAAREAYEGGKAEDGMARGAAGIRGYEQQIISALKSAGDKPGGDIQSSRQRMLAVRREFSSMDDAPLVGLLPHREAILEALADAGFASPAVSAVALEFDAIEKAAGIADAGSILDKVMDVAGGGSPFNVEWTESGILKPSTSALPGMRAAVIGATIERLAGNRHSLELLLDYKGFAMENSAIAIAADGQAPAAVEAVHFRPSLADGHGLEPIAKMLDRSFDVVAAAKQATGPSEPSAAEQRKADERLLMAEAANLEVVRAGGTPPAPLPPVNTDPAAQRIHFWTTREEQSPYHYQKLCDIAAEAGVAVLVDRAKDSKTKGLRYVEMTRAEVGKLPAELKFFLTHEAKAAHIESKERSAASKSLVTDAAATLAADVIAKDADGKLYPLTVVHPDKDLKGWLKVSTIIHGMEPARLAKLMDLTHEKARDLEAERAKLRTAGGDLTQSKAVKLEGLLRGISVGNHVLAQRGIIYEEKQKAMEPPAKAADGAIAAFQDKPANAERQRQAKQREG